MIKLSEGEKESNFTHSFNDMFWDLRVVWYIYVGSFKEHLQRLFTEIISFILYHKPVTSSSSIQEAHDRPFVLPVTSPSSRSHSCWGFYETGWFTFYWHGGLCEVSVYFCRWCHAANFTPASHSLPVVLIKSVLWLHSKGFPSYTLQYKWLAQFHIQGFLAVHQKIWTGCSKILFIGGEYHRRSFSMVVD